MTIDIESLHSVQQLSTIMDEWRSLHEHGENSSPPLHPDWVMAWLDAYGQQYCPDGSLRVLTGRSNGKLVAVLPLYLSSERVARVPARVLRFVSTGEAEFEETCPDYLDMLCSSAHATEASAAMWRHIMASTDWQALDLLEMSVNSTFLAAAEPPGSPTPPIRLDRGECPRADIAQGVEGLLPQLSAKTRRNTRRLLRDVAADNLTLAIADTPASAASAFDDLVALHTARWKVDDKPGAFESPRFLTMHRNLALQWTESGRAILATLREQDRSIAVIYGFTQGQEFHFYQCGVTRERLASVHSPGIAANLLLMDVLSTRGITVYDFLRGGQSYKHDYRTNGTRLTRLRLLRSPLLRAADGGQRWLRERYVRIRAAVRGRPNTPPPVSPADGE
ncbi:MAG: GNAT family N-acetyltransferase [Gemmatimonadota bacterium]